MNALSKLNIGDTVSFEVHPQILGTGFKRVKILAILDMDTAKYWIDPVAMHINVFPSLPSGVVNRADGYSYVKIQYPNGEVTCLGLPWIRSSSIVRHEGGKMTIRFDDITVEDMDKVMLALSSNGHVPDFVDRE